MSLNLHFLISEQLYYGEKSKLNDPESLPTPNFAEEFEEVLKNGSIQTVRLSIYEGYICRGSKDYKMSHVQDFRTSC